MSTRVVMPAALLVCLSAAAGCNKAHLNDPFVDHGALLRVDMTTPSAEGYRSQTPGEPHANRAWDESTAWQRSGDVTHWPIWWEDPFIDKGNDPTGPDDRDAADQTFAVACVDLLAIPYGWGRFVLNSVAWPVSAVVTPPGTLMASDGRLSRGCLGYDHDAARAGDAPPDPPHHVRIWPADVPPIEVLHYEPPATQPPTPIPSQD